MKKLIISILVVIVIVSTTSLFQVSEVENAVVIRLGKPQRVVTEPGYIQRFHLLMMLEFLIKDY